MINLGHLTQRIIVIVLYPQNGDRIVTIGLCDVTSAYVLSRYAVWHREGLMSEVVLNRSESRMPEITQVNTQRRYD